MTLLIACMLMDHIGGYTAWHYVVVSLLWVAHLGWHSLGSQ